MEHDVVIKEFSDFLNDASKKYNFCFEIINIKNFMGMIFSKDEKVWSYFSEIEKSNLEKYTNPKKRIHWMAGRYAGKIAVKKYLVTKFNNIDINSMQDSEISILNGFNQVPYIKGKPELTISISHSYPYCIAVISENGIGVDIENTFNIRESMLKLYYTTHEISKIQNLNQKYNLNNSQDMKAVDMLATLYWTRKEAISKLKKLGMNIDFSKVDTVDDITTLAEFNDEKVRTISTQNTYCSLSLAFEDNLITLLGQRKDSNLQ